MVTHGRPLAVEGCAESSLNFFLLGSVTLPVVDNTFDQSGQDNYKLLDKPNITTYLVLSIYHHRELFDQELVLTDNSKMNQLQQWHWAKSESLLFH